MEYLLRKNLSAIGFYLDLNPESGPVQIHNGFKQNISINITIFYYSNPPGLFSFFLGVGLSILFVGGVLRWDILGLEKNQQEVLQDH